MLGEEILTKLNQEKASKRKSKKPQTRHKRTEKQENLNPIEETYKFLENTPKLQTIMSDDCLLTGIKLLQRTENMNNLYMIILAKCPLIFDERLPIFE